jgi:hypothetical protein
MIDFDTIKLELDTRLLSADGKYKTGKLNAKECAPLKAKIDELIIPGLKSRTEKMFALRNNLKEAPKCTCGKYLNLLNATKFTQYCSAKCSANSASTKLLRKDTNLQKYGAEHAASATSVKAKIESTNIARYGSRSSWASPDVRKKMKASMLELYGTENAAKSQVIKDKIRESHASRSEDEKAGTLAKRQGTNLEKYGVLFPQTLEAQRKQASQQSVFENAFVKDGLSQFLQKLKEESGISPIFLTEEWAGYTKSYTWQHDVCKKTFDGTVWNGIRSIQCPFCKTKSKVQQWIEDLVSSTGLDYIVEDRKQIAPYELDVLIPGKHLAIEVNGIFWHHTKARTQPLLSKTKAFRGTLLHFWDFEINHREQAIKNIVLSKLGVLPKIGARQLKVQEVPKKEAKIFFEANHLQGYAPCAVVFGLYQGTELLSATSFGRPRFSSRGDWELIRFASAGVSIQGGLSRLLKAFAKDKEGELLVTFADRRISNGEVYVKTGFTPVGESSPNYFYFKGDVMLPRYKAMKHKLKDLVQDFDPSMTEGALMARDGWLKCEDCGNLKYELQL